MSSFDCRSPLCSQVPSPKPLSKRGSRGAEKKLGSALTTDKDLFPRILDHLSGSGGVQKDQIKYVTHRIVHGGTNKKPLVVTKQHPEALKDMDKLGEFAPLHVSCMIWLRI